MSGLSGEGKLEVRLSRRNHSLLRRVARDKPEQPRHSEFAELMQNCHTWIFRKEFFGINRLRDENSAVGLSFPPMAD